MIAWQDPPPYVQHIAEVELLAKTASGCETVGYTADVSAGEAAMRSLIRAGVVSGIDADFTMSAWRDALDRFKANLDAIGGTDGMSEEENRDSAAAVRALLNRRCSEAAAAYPAVLQPGPEAGRVFGGWTGVWLDYPLVGEAAYYLSSRATCRAFTPTVTAGELVDHWMPAFASVPASARGSVREYLLESYQPAADIPISGDRCARIMARATEALTTSWSAHFDGSPPTQPLP